jgi:release factor glutamine methyltransferase
VIVSNPPYIPTSEIELLQIEINYEPRIALDGGTDGLDFYRKIAFRSTLHLKEDGFLIMEIGFEQAGKLSEIFQDTGIFKITDIVKDYNGIKRVMVLQKHSIKNG